MKENKITYKETETIHNKHFFFFLREIKYHVDCFPKKYIYLCLIFRENKLHHSIN